MRQLNPGDFTTVPCNSVAGMDPYSQTVYMWLCQHANGSNVCWPSVATLMEKCGIKSRSKIKESIKRLTEKGLVKKDERKENGINTSNLYEVFYEDGSQYGLPPAAIRPTPGRNTATELKPLEPKPKEQETQVAIATAPKAVVPFGNSGVNEVIADIRAACSACDYAYCNQDERRKAHNLAVGKDFNAAAQSHGMTAPQFAANIVRLSSNNDFWAGKVTGPLSVHKHWTKVYNSGKTDFKKETAQQAVGVKSYDF